MFFLTPFILAASLAALPFQAMHSYSRHASYGHINNMSKYNRVFQGIKPVIMMFSAPWCTACKIMEPSFNEIASLHNHNVDFYVVNTDEVRPLIDKLGIKGLPTIICAKEGQILHQERRGAMDKRELADCVHTFLSKVTSLKKTKARQKQPTPQAKVQKPVVTKPKVKQQAPEQKAQKAIAKQLQPTKNNLPTIQPIEKKPLVKQVPSKKLAQPEKPHVPVRKRKRKKVQPVQVVQPVEAVPYETVQAYFYEEGNPYPQNYLEVDNYPVVM